MKKSFKYILIAAVILFQTGCNDWLELRPPSGLIREEFWQSKEDVEAVLMAAYSTFSGLDDMMFIHGELRADMVRGVNQGGANLDLMNGNIYPDNWLANWENFYKVINYANEVIKNAPDVDDPTFTDFQLRGFMSEAYFLRSLAYFYLVRIWGDVPLVLEPTESDNVNVYLPKSPDDEVLDHITQDLLEARLYLASNYLSVIETKSRASRESCEALLADIALWRFDYEAVVQHVQIIEDRDNIELMPSGRWFEMFYPGSSLESIFEFHIDDRLEQRNKVYGLTDHTANSYFAVSNSAMQMLSSFYTTEQRFRGERVTISRRGEDNYSIWKYVGLVPDGSTVRSGNLEASANWIVYRYADVLLMKAEALSQLGRYNEALQYINLIRDRAGAPAINPSQTPIVFEDAIMNERALELAYEGKRWFDLVRMGRRNDYARRDKLVEIIIQNVPSTQKRILASKLTNPLGWYMPVYKNELERNLNLEQNPYYNR